MAEMPQDPFLPPGLGGAMKALYELYAASVQAGFAPDQAMQLVIATLTALTEKAPSVKEA